MGTGILMLGFSVSLPKTLPMASKSNPACLGIEGIGSAGSGVVDPGVRGGGGGGVEECFSRRSGRSSSGIATFARGVFIVELYEGGRDVVVLIGEVGFVDFLKKLNRDFDFFSSSSFTTIRSIAISMSYTPTTAFNQPTSLLK